MDMRVILLLMIVIGLAGCGETPAPESLEPQLELLPVADLTRTEATLSARVVRRSSAEIVRVAFVYGENGELDKEYIVESERLFIDPGFTFDKSASGEEISVRLEGLTPGREYGYSLEVATKRATVRSDIGRFTTEPNVVPSVSAFTPLSTGPTGVILSFEIMDDGGEPLRAAGCEVYCKRSGVTSRAYLAPEYLSEGTHRLYLTGLETDTEYTFTPFAANSIGEERGEVLEYTTLPGIVLTESGMLSRLFGGNPDLVMDEMRISGDMDGDDFRFLRSVLGAPLPLSGGMASAGSRVGSVDLTDVRICTGGGSYDGSRYTVADEVTTGLFADCAGLRRILLPASAKVLARDAFARCANLESITVSAGMERVVPSAECQNLRAIEVSAANGFYTSVDGVLFNRDETEILWFPLGKGGDYTLPSGITALGENSFFGTSITGLVIPESVTSISRGAFAGSALREITLPANLTNVSEGILQNCASLEILHLGSGTEYIGPYAFDGTRLKELYVAAIIPPVVATDGFACRDYPLQENCMLYVPASSRGVYRNHRAWGGFENIESK